MQADTILALANPNGYMSYLAVPLLVQHPFNDGSALCFEQTNSAYAKYWHLEVTTDPPDQWANPITNPMKEQWQPDGVIFDPSI